MTSFILLSRTFSVPESSKKFLESYLARVDGFIRKHGLDPQLSEDLSERLIEKLSDAEKLGEISEKLVVSIVNSLGEPEDIFRDILETSTTSTESRLTKADVKEFFRREFHRDGKNGIILGVCAGLAQTFEINAIWIRILFLSLIPAYGFIILIYLILGVLLPDISKPSHLGGGTDFGKRAEWAAEDIERLAKNVEAKTQDYRNKHGDSIIVRIFSGIAGIFVILAKALAKTIVFCVLAGVAVALLGAGIGVICIAGFASAHPIIDNQAIFSAIPTWLPAVALACGIAGIILSLIVGSRAIGKGIGGGWLAACCFVVLGVGLFSAVQTGTSVFWGFQNTYSTGVNSTVQIASGSTLTVNVDNISLTHFNRNHFLDFGGNRPSIELAVSSDENIHVESKSIIRTTHVEESENILAKVNPVVGTLQGNTLTFTITGEKDFSSVVPLTLLSREIRISLPKSIRIKIVGLYGKQFGIYWSSETSEAMQAHGIRSCGDLERFYDTKSNGFICHDEQTIQDAIKHERESFLRDQNADFFWDDAEGWVRIRSIEHSGSWVVIATWYDRDKTNRKLRLEFADKNDSEDNPIVLKKESISNLPYPSSSSGSTRVETSSH